MEKQIFVSHTKADADFCDDLDRICARVGIRAFRSEFESIPPPAWKTIKQAMGESIAMFLLVGRELVAHQSYHSPEWSYTRNWIAYEVGIACQRGMDVWVLCDEVEINFPVPYFNNYAPFNITSERNFGFMRHVLSEYKRGRGFPVPDGDTFVVCPGPSCGAEFNLRIELEPDKYVVCPQCLGHIIFPSGFLKQQ